MPYIICTKCNKLVLEHNAHPDTNLSICLKCHDKEHLTLDQVVEEKYKLKGVIDEQQKLLEQTLEVNATLRYLEEENANLRRENGLKREEVLKTVDNYSLSDEFLRRGKEAYPNTPDREREFLLNGPSLALYDEVIRRCEEEDGISDQFKRELHSLMGL